MGTTLIGRHTASKWFSEKRRSYGTPVPLRCQPRRLWHFPTPKSLWGHERRPSLCAIAYPQPAGQSAPAVFRAAPLKDLQQQQAVLHNYAERGGEGRGGGGFIVYISCLFVVCCSLVFLRFPLLFRGDRGCVKEEDEKGPGLTPRARVRGCSERGRQPVKTHLTSSPSFCVHRYLN